MGVTSRLRLRGHDYAEPASYYVTLCTEARLCLFGDVQDDNVELSVAGQVVESWWGNLPLRFPMTGLDAFVVMPNHLHGILTIQADPTVPIPEDVPNLSRILQWFKSVTTVDYTLGVRDHGWPAFPGELWQPGFYDHIIRNDRDLERIRAYIEGNPAGWTEDEFNMEPRKGRR
jgi:REP element-mobilizing transposase RayT